MNSKRKLGNEVGIVMAAALSSAAASSPSVVSFKLSADFPIVMARIAGTDVPLQFDSGDQSTLVLHRSVLDRIKAQPTGESVKMHDLKGNVMESPTYRIPRFQIGRARFTDVIARLDIHDASYQATDAGQKGFLGTGLFKSYEVVFDYAHRTMTLVPRADGEGPSKNCKGISVPFAPEWKGEPVTEVYTDLGRVVLWWDTGSPVSVLNKKVVREARPSLSEDFFTTRQFTLAGTDFGPLRLDTWDMSLPPGFDGLLGYNFFAQHVVCIDFPNKQIVIPQ